jgi:hypothetical protein
MFVHVRCMHVSIPISFWHVLTSSDVRSDVRPPAFLRRVSTSSSQRGVRAPGDVDELWAEPAHALDAVQQIL